MICQIATVRFPPATYRQIKAAAENSHMSVNAVIVAACEAFLESRKEVGGDN